LNNQSSIFFFFGVSHKINSKKNRNDECTGFCIRKKKNKPRYTTNNKKETEKEKCELLKIMPKPSLDTEESKLNKLINDRNSAIKNLRAINKQIQAVLYSLSPIDSNVTFKKLEAYVTTIVKSLVPLAPGQFKIDTFEIQAIEKSTMEGSIQISCSPVGGYVASDILMHYFTKLLPNTCITRNMSTYQNDSVIIYLSQNLDKFFNTFG
jgi:hypothetical protein